MLPLCEPAQLHADTRLLHRVLQRFPDKFFFFDLSRAWTPVWKPRDSKDRAEIIFLLCAIRAGRATASRTLELGINARPRSGLGCAPVVNLFPQTAEPILLDQRRYEYPVIPDVRRQNALEIFSVDQVVQRQSANARGDGSRSSRSTRTGTQCHAREEANVLDRPTAGRRSASE